MKQELAPRHRALPPRSCGYVREVTVPRQEVHSVHELLLAELAARFRQHKDRFIVFLTGPPGSVRRWLPRSGNTSPLGDILLWCCRPAAGRLPSHQRRTRPSHGVGRWQRNPATELKGNAGELRSGGDHSRPAQPCDWRGATLASLRPRHPRPHSRRNPGADSRHYRHRGNYLLLDEPGWRDLRALSDSQSSSTCRKKLPGRG